MNEPTIGESTTIDNGRLLEMAEQIARMVSDGHLSILRFTTNWRVGFTTSDSRESIGELAVGKTLEEALRKAIAALGRRAVWASVTPHTPTLRAGYEVRLP